MAFSNSEGKKLYFNVAEGKFHLYRGKTQPEEEYDTVDGDLEFLGLYADQAPGYAPKEVFAIGLRDGEELLIIKSTAKTVFTRMFAGFLGSMAKGQRVKLQLRSGSNNAKVTTCFVETFSSGEWHKLPYDSIQGSDDAKAAEALSRIRSHACFDAAYAPKPAQQAPTEFGAAMGPQQQRLLDVLMRHGYPPLAPNEAVYAGVFRRVLKDNDIRLATMTEAQFAFFADQFEKVAKDKPRWPKELRDLPAEYDPFADE